MMWYYGKFITLISEKISMNNAPLLGCQGHLVTWIITNNYYIPLCTVILYTWYNIKILHRGGYFSASGNIKYFPSMNSCTPSSSKPTPTKFILFESRIGLIAETSRAANLQSKNTMWKCDDVYNCISLWKLIGV